MRYETLRDAYTYLRSTQRLLTKSQLGQRWPTWRNIELKIEYLMSKEGFGDEDKIQEIQTILEQKKLGPKQSFADRMTELGLGKGEWKVSKEEATAKKYLAAGARAQRARNWQYRLEVAIKEAVHKGWYPIFATYTVDPMRTAAAGYLTRDAMWADAEAGHWNRFVQRMKVEIGEACGYGRRTANYPKTETFMKYWAIVEHGKTGDHPHVHVVWLAKQIKNSWKQDPNANCKDETETDIRSASAIWEWGTQKQTKALFIVGAPWIDKLKWVVPTDPKTGKKTKVGHAGQVAGYVGKYLTKDGGARQWKTTGTYHRVKATKRIGLTTITETLKKVPTLGILFALATRPEDYKTSMKIQTATSCPLALLREISKKVLLRRLSFMRAPLARSLLRSHWTQPRHAFFMTYINSILIHSQKPWKMMPSPRYSYYTQMLQVPASMDPSRGPMVHDEKKELEILAWLRYNLPRTQQSLMRTQLKGEYAI